MGSIEIHKNERHRITTDGLTAEKTGTQSVRRMKYYPERDIEALAGEIDELTAWKIMRDVASQAAILKTPINPSHVFIDGDCFVLSEWSESQDERFTASEGYAAVWALAATVFYVFLGCHVFQGLGGKGQSVDTPIPTLRKNMPQLSGMIIRCLAFNPSDRPTLNEILEESEKNIARCMAKRNDFPPLKKAEGNVINLDEIDHYWPEEMY